MFCFPSITSVRSGHCSASSLLQFFLLYVLLCRSILFLKYPVPCILSNHTMTGQNTESRGVFLQHLSFFFPVSNGFSRLEQTDRSLEDHQTRAVPDSPPKTHFPVNGSRADFDMCAGEQRICVHPSPAEDSTIPTPAPEPSQPSLR